MYNLKTIENKELGCSTALQQPLTYTSNVPLIYKLFDPKVKGVAAAEL